MNSIYKVIWSKAKNCYVVASEIARSHTKSASGSEKIGGGTRRKLLASLMALSLLCGGLGVAEATVHVNEGTGVTSEVYTTGETYNRTEADTKYAKANDVTANTTEIAGLKTAVGDAGSGLTKAVADQQADIAVNKANITALQNELGNKADTTALNNKADKAITLTGYGITDAYTKDEVNNALNDKANKATVNALVGRVGDLATALGNKADKADLDTANGEITALKNKTANLSDDGKELKDMTTVSGTTVSGDNVKAGELTVTGEIKDGAGVTTTLAKINDSMTQTATNTGNIANLKTKTDGQQTAIDDLKKKTTKIDYDAANDTTSINGIKVGDQVDMGGKKLTNVGTINGIDIGDAQVDMKGKNLTGVGTINGTEIGTNVDGNYIHQDSSIWGNMNNVDTQVKTNADNIKTNTTAITTLNTKVGEIDDRTGGITRNTEDTQTTIENSVKVDNQGNVKDVKGLSAETITTGALTVTGASDLKGNVTLGTPNGTNTVTVNGTANFYAVAKMNNDLTVTGDTNLGNTTVDGNLKVTGTITTDKMVFGDKATNNYTEIDHGKVTSTNLEVRAGQAISSSSTFDVEKNEVGFGNGITDEQSSHKQTSDVITDTVKNNNTGDQSFHKQTSDVIMDNVRDGKNSNNRTQTKTETKDIITDENGNSSTTSQTANENKTYLTDKDRKNTNSTIDTAKGYDKTIKGENGKTSTKQDELNITNTAQNGTITNDAQNIVNKANTMDTNVTGQATESYGKLDTTVNGAENHTVNGQQTNTVGGGQINNITGGQKNNILTGNQETTVSNGSIINKAENGDISNTAKNVTNVGTESVTNKVGTNEVKVSQGGVDIKVGADTSRTMTDGRIIDKAGDMTVTTDKTTGTTFENGTPKDTTVINGGTIGTNKVNANETNTKKLTAGADDGAVGGRLTVDADGVKGSYESGKYTSKSYILANTLKSGVDNGKKPTDTDFVGSRTDHYMDGDKAKLDETVKDADGSNVTNKTSTGTATTITDGNGNISATIQNAKNLAGSVTNGTETGVSGIHANDDGSVSIDSAVAGGSSISTINQKKDSITSQVTDGTTITKTEQGTKDITNTATAGTITNDAKDIVNKAQDTITNTAGTSITNQVKDSKVTTDVDGTTFENKTAAVSDGGTTTTKINGNHINTGRVDANELGVSDKDDQGNTADLSVKAGEGIKSSATDKDGNTTYTKVTATENSFQVQDKDGKNKNHQVNTKGSSVTEITDKDGNTTKTEQTATDITNEASNSITDKVGTNTRVLNKDGITDTVGGSTFKQRIDAIMMESKNVSIKAEEKLTNEAKVITNKASEVINNEAININNTATGIIKSKASEIQNQADRLISNKVGENTWENMEDGKITTSIKNGTKQNLTQSDAEKTEHSVVNGSNSTVNKQTSEEITDAVTNGTTTNVTQNTATSSNNTIADKNGNANTVISTADGTSFINSKAAAPVTGASGAGTAVNTTIKGNTITTGKVTMDYADVMKDLGVRGNAKVDQNLEVGGTSTLKGDVTMGSNATVKKDLTVEGNTNLKNTKVDGTLDVTQKANFGDSVSIAKDLSVGGNATIKGDVTAKSYKVGDKTYISAAGINANDQKITNVADGSISEGSKDAVNGGQLYTVKNDLEGKVNKVGANAAAMANLHPMEFDPDSKWNIAAAIGNYGSETAAALGAFYRPNDDVMVNLSTAFGTGENMVGGGVSVRLGKGGNKLSREESNALKDQVNDLTARMDALLSVLNPNMSKDFPDVPENHWAYEAVSRLAGNDIVQGYPDGEFHGERTMTRYEMAEIIYNALSRGAEAEKELVEEFKPELQAMAASEKATAERAEG